MYCKLYIINENNPELKNVFPSGVTEMSPIITKYTCFDCKYENLCKMSKGNILKLLFVISGSFDL